MTDAFAGNAVRAALDRLDGHAKAAPEWTARSAGGKGRHEIYSAVPSVRDYGCSQRSRARSLPPPCLRQRRARDFPGVHATVWSGERVQGLQFRRETISLLPPSESALGARVQ